MGVDGRLDRDDPIGSAGHAHPHGVGGRPHLAATGPATADDDPAADPHHPEHPHIGVVGAGRVGSALGVALDRAGWPVVAVASRDPARRDAFLRLVPGARVYAEAAMLLDEVDLILLTVPDDAITVVAAGLRLYGGQALVHTSGLLPASVLEPAMAAGSMAGAFHPLVAFADLDRALAALPGATVALDAQQPLLGLLGEMAEALGAQPVRIPGSGRAAYHAAAMLAAGGFVGLLDAIAEVGRGAGLDEAGALAIYGPLIRHTLDDATALGVDAALTGPFVRGDEGTVRAHLAALEQLAPGAVPLYAAVAEREVTIAEGRGAISVATADRLRALVRHGIDRTREGHPDPA